MLLTSPAYFVFLALLFVAYWPAARYRYGRLALVLFANLFFYAKWDLVYLLVIPAASTVDYFIGGKLGRTSLPAARRALLSVSVLVNVGLIVSARSLLPLGLSFYAFQALTYTIDVYRRDTEPARSYLAYLCSSTLFPTTLAGPITRIPLS